MLCHRLRRWSNIKPTLGQHGQRIVLLHHTHYLNVQRTHILYNVIVLHRLFPGVNHINRTLTNIKGCRFFLVRRVLSRQV